MLARFLPAMAVAGALCAPGSVAAQSPTFETAVTFLVPVTLTQLSPDLEKIKLHCLIHYNEVFPKTPSFPAGAVPMPEDEATVIMGQVITTMKVEYVIPSGWLLKEAAGTLAYYHCNFQGFSKSLQKWAYLSETATESVFRVTPLPGGSLNGTFKW